MKYMEALFERFCGYPSIPEELEVQRKTLGDQLSEPQRKLLLKYQPRAGSGNDLHHHGCHGRILGRRADVAD